MSTPLTEITSPPAVAGLERSLGLRTYDVSAAIYKRVIHASVTDTSANDHSSISVPASTLSSTLSPVSPRSQSDAEVAVVDTDDTRELCYADIPGGLAVKKFGFWVVPAATVSFGIVTLCTGFIHNRESFFAMRLLLGITERCVPALGACLCLGSSEADSLSTSLQLHHARMRVRHYEVLQAT